MVRIRITPTLLKSIHSTSESRPRYEMKSLKIFIFFLFLGPEEKPLSNIVFSVLYVHGCSYEGIKGDSAPLQNSLPLIEKLKFHYYEASLTICISH